MTTRSQWRVAFLLTFIFSAWPALSYVTTSQDEAKQTPTPWPWKLENVDRAIMGYRWQEDSEAAAVDDNIDIKAGDIGASITVPIHASMFPAGELPELVDVRVNTPGYHQVVATGYDFNRPSPEVDPWDDVYPLTQEVEGHPTLVTWGHLDPHGVYVISILVRLKEGQSIESLKLSKPVVVIRYKPRGTE